MSGNSGFSGGGVDNDPGYSAYRNSGFASAMNAYGSRSVGADPPKSGAKPPPGASAVASPPPTAPMPRVDLKPRVLRVTAKNCIVIAVDTTGSMSGWPLEIFDRLGFLHTEAEKMYGGPVQILFIGFGDVPACNDPFEVTPLGQGPELLGYLAQLNKSSSGGGNNVESSDLVLAFVDSMVDFSAAQNVSTFIITDEKISEDVNFGRMPPWTSARGDRVLAAPVEEVVRSARVKQDLFAIIKPYGDVRELNEKEDPDVLFRDSFTQQVLDCWNRVLGAEWVAKLPVRQRVVDVILGCLAKRLGKEAEFDDALVKRQASTTHGFGKINIRVVRSSIASVGNKKLKPITRSTALLPAGTPAAPASPNIIDVDLASAPPSNGPPVTRSSRLLPP